MDIYEGLATEIDFLGRMALGGRLKEVSNHKSLTSRAPRSFRLTVAFNSALLRSYTL